MSGALRKDEKETAESGEKEVTEGTRPGEHFGLV